MCSSQCSFFPLPPQEQLQECVPHPPLPMAMLNLPFKNWTTSWGYLIFWLHWLQSTTLLLCNAEHNPTTPVLSALKSRTRNADLVGLAISTNAPPNPQKSAGKQCCTGWGFSRSRVSSCMKLLSPTLHPAGCSQTHDQQEGNASFAFLFPNCRRLRSDSTNPHKFGEVVTLHK